MQVHALRNLFSGILKVALVLLGIVALGILLDFLAGFPTYRNDESVVVGVALAGFGVCLETWGTHALWKFGLGTPNPVDPPSRLVTKGPYRFSRNPLYVARLSMIIGGSAIFGSFGILLMSFILFAGLHFFLVPKEEQRLQARHGDDYLFYKAKVSRWITLSLSRTLRRKPIRPA